MEAAIRITIVPRAASARLLVPAILEVLQVRFLSVALFKVSEEAPSITLSSRSYMSRDVLSRPASTITVAEVLALGRLLTIASAFSCRPHLLARLGAAPLDCALCQLDLLAPCTCMRDLHESARLIGEFALMMSRERRLGSCSAHV